MTKAVGSHQTLSRHLVGTCGYRLYNPDEAINRKMVSPAMKGHFWVDVCAAKAYSSWNEAKRALPGGFKTHLVLFSPSGNHILALVTNHASNQFAPLMQKTSWRPSKLAASTCAEFHTGASYYPAKSSSWTWSIHSLAAWPMGMLQYSTHLSKILIKKSTQTYMGLRSQSICPPFTRRQEETLWFQNFNLRSSRNFNPFSDASQLRRTS